MRMCTKKGTGAARAPGAVLYNHLKMFGLDEKVLSRPYRRAITHVLQVSKGLFYGKGNRIILYGF